MARKGRLVESQMKELLERMGFENSIPEKPSGEKWSSKELLDLLEKNTDNRLPGMMKEASRSLLERQGQRYILDRGYKVDYLLYSPKLQGYIMIDFLLYPEKEDWSRLLEKRESIISLDHSGVYEELNIRKAGVLLVEPEGDKDVIDEVLEEAQEDKVYEFLTQLEESKDFLSPTFVIDLRQYWGGLASPPE